MLKVWLDVPFGGVMTTDELFTVRLKLPEKPLCEMVNVSFVSHGSAITLLVMVEPVKMMGAGLGVGDGVAVGAAVGLVVAVPPDALHWAKAMLRAAITTSPKPEILGKDVPFEERCGK
jgi:hypothetical protein